MSGYKFRLLLEYDGVLEKIESFLEHNEPHISLVERTARQMRLFVDAAKKSESPLVVLFEKVIGILEAYANQILPDQ